MLLIFFFFHFFFFSLQFSSNTKQVSTFKQRNALFFQACFTSFQFIYITETSLYKSNPRFAPNIYHSKNEGNLTLVLKIKNIAYIIDKICKIYLFIVV